MRPSALLVDLDGVIRRWPPLDALVEQRYGFAPGSVRAAAFAPALLQPAITGACTDQTWRARIAESLGRTYGIDRARRAIADWSGPAGDVDRDTLAILDRCRPSLRIVLVTNATSRLPLDLERLGLSERFAAVVNSSEIGAAKPAAAIYAAALRSAAVDAGAAIYADDSAVNVQAASALGIRSHRFVDHAAFERFLREQGALERDGR
jgi:putative hydrolase of the HAD superfamily